MRIGWQSAAGLELATEVLEVFLRESTLEKGARVDAGGSVTLKIYEIPAVVGAACPQEVIERNL
jgi:hypothetical protein